MRRRARLRNKPRSGKSSSIGDLSCRPSAASDPSHGRALTFTLCLVPVLEWTLSLRLHKGFVRCSVVVTCCPAPCLPASPWARVWWRMGFRRRMRRPARASDVKRANADYYATGLPMWPFRVKVVNGTTLLKDVGFFPAVQCSWWRVQGHTSVSGGQRLYLHAARRYGLGAGWRAEQYRRLAARARPDRARCPQAPGRVPLGRGRFRRAR